MNFLKQHGKKLIDNGYRIVPIPEGEKFPKGYKGWEKFNADHAMVDQWVKAGVTGVAVLCEHTPAVDLDIPENDLSRDVWEDVKRIAGEGPLRFGNRPKSLMPFKTLAPFGKLASKKYQNPDDPLWSDGKPKTYQVEILGAGNEFVAYAIHPETKKPYEWNKHHGELYNTPRANLPTLDEYKAKEIIAAFEAKVPAKWVIYKKKSNNNSGNNSGGLSGGLSGGQEMPPGQVGGEGHDLPTADTFANMKTKWGGSADKMRAILQKIDPTDYKMWVDAGFAIWHETDGSDVGFKLWDEWSRGALEEYEKSGSEAQRRVKWATYNWKPLAEQDKPFKTFKSLVFFANGGALKDGKEVSDFLNRFFYIHAGKKVFDSTMQDDMGWAFCELDEFHEFYKNVRVVEPVMASTEKDPTRMKDKTFFISQEWQKHENRKSCNYLVYKPGKAVINHIRNHMYEINKCKMPVFPMVQGLNLEVFHDHMTLLFPSDADRHWFISWMARKIQNPANKCDVTPLLVAPEEGVGRSWLGVLMFKLLGSVNCKRVEIKALSSGNAFNSYLNESLLCVIDEVFQKSGGQGGGEGKYAISSALKSKITEKYVEINIKYEVERMKQVYTDFLLMTNERDALSFSDTNRRIAVFIYEGMARGAEYYTRLYEWIESDENIGGLWWYLRGYDISGVDFQRAPYTAAKKDMINEGKSPIEHAIDDIILDGEFNATTPDLLLGYLRDNAGRFEGLNAFKMENSGQIRKILMHKRCSTRWSSEKVRIGGRGTRQYRVWILNKEIDMDLEKVKIDLIKQGAC